MKSAQFAGTVLVQGANLIRREDLGPITNANSPGQATVINLLPGNLAVTVSANSIGVLIKPPVGQVSTLTILGSVADVAPIPLDVNYPSFLPIDPSQTTYYINGGGSTIALPIVEI